MSNYKTKLYAYKSCLILAVFPAMFISLCFLVLKSYQVYEVCFGICSNCNKLCHVSWVILTNSHISNVFYDMFWSPCVYFHVLQSFIHKIFSANASNGRNTIKDILDSSGEYQETSPTFSFFNIVLLVLFHGIYMWQWCLKLYPRKDAFLFLYHILSL